MGEVFLVLHFFVNTTTTWNIFLKEKLFFVVVELQSLFYTNNVSLTRAGIIWWVEFVVIRSRDAERKSLKGHYEYYAHAHTHKKKRNVLLILCLSNQQLFPMRSYSIREHDTQKESRLFQQSLEGLWKWNIRNKEKDNRGTWLPGL